MELNREQIKKALENWVKNYDGNALDFIILCNALTLITSQEQRIKELTEENDVRKRCNIMLNNELRRIDNIKADTVRKMQERVNEQFRDKYAYRSDYIHELIDQIAKEMLEGGDVSQLSK